MNWQKNVKYIIISFLVILLPILLLTCILHSPYVNANYTYNGTSATYDWGEISVHTILVGTAYSPIKVPEENDKDILVEDIQGNITLTFKANDAMNANVQVDDIEFIDIDNNIKLEPLNFRGNSQFSERKPVKMVNGNYVKYGSGPYVAKVFSKDTDLKFVDYKLSFRYKISPSSGDVITNRATLFLHKNGVFYFRSTIISR